LKRCQIFLRANHIRCLCRGSVLLGVEPIFYVRMVAHLIRLDTALLCTSRLTVIGKPVRGLVKEVKCPHHQLQDCMVALTSQQSRGTVVTQQNELRAGEDERKQERLNKTVTTFPFIYVIIRSSAPANGVSKTTRCHSMT